MITLSLNDAIGNLHDSAVEAAEELVHKWRVRLTTLNGGRLLVNDAILEGTNNEGSRYDGSEGVHRIVMHRSGFFGKARAKLYMGEYLRHFIGIDPKDINWNDLEAGEGSVFGTKYWVFEYEIDAPRKIQHGTKIRPDRKQQWKPKPDERGAKNKKTQYRFRDGNSDGSK